MSDLPASHYLRIYRLKLGSAEGGTTHPKAEWVNFVRRLVAALESLDPDAKVRLEANSPAQVCFRDASTGAILAQFDGIADV
jgi:hypothetical protein